jgi:sugar lactone lactonase YvrE
VDASTRAAWVIVGGATITAVACGFWPTFPDDRLHPYAMDSGLADGDLPDGTAPGDGGPVPSDGGGMDGASQDATVADSVAKDGAPLDAAPEVMTDPCARPPTLPVTALRLFDGVADSFDLAMDGAGALAVGTRDAVDRVTVGGARTSLLSALRGDVTVLRYSPTGELLLGLLSRDDAGAALWSLVQAPAAGGSVMPRVSGLRSVGGLALDPSGGLWIADTEAGTVLRVPPGGTAPRVMVRDVVAPTHLTFNRDGSALFIATRSRTVYRVAVTYPAVPADAGADAGADVADAEPSDLVTATDSADVVAEDSDLPPCRGQTEDGVSTGCGLPSAGGFEPITGLAMDVCGYLYVATEGMVIWRIPPAEGPFQRFVTGVQPRGLAFGQGPGFSPTALYTLSADTGAVYTADVGIPGVPRPVPPRMP